MNKAIIILFITAFSCFQADGQGARFKLSSGYALPVFNQSVEGYYDVLLDANQTSKTEISRSFSLGSGWNIAGGMQYDFSDHFSMGLDVQYLHGSKIRFVQEDAISTVLSSNNQDLFARSIRFIPHLEVRAEENIVQPFLRLGFVISSTSVYMHEEGNVGSNNISRDWEYKSNSSLGIDFGTGLIYPLKRDNALFLSLNYQKIIYKPTSLSMTAAIENDIDILSSYPVIEREISYTSHIDTEYNTSPDPLKPKLLHDIYFPFTSLILNVGIQFYL